MRINMQDKVKEILINKPNTKDNDFYLMYWIWNEEFYNLKSEQMNHSDSFDRIDVMRLLRLLNNKELTHPSAIMRARRKVQENNPLTRGKLWEKRHQEQLQVQRDLGYQAFGDEVI